MLQLTQTISCRPLSSLLEEYKVALSAEFKPAISPLEVKLDYVQATVTDHGLRLTSLEENANHISDKVEALEANYAAMKGSLREAKN